MTYTASLAYHSMTARGKVVDLHGHGALPKILANTILTRSMQTTLPSLALSHARRTIHPWQVETMTFQDLAISP